MLSVFNMMHGLIGGTQDLTGQKKRIWRKAMMEFLSKYKRMPTASEMGVIKRRLGL